MAAAAAFRAAENTEEPDTGAGKNMYGDEFRNYADSARQAIVEENYRRSHVSTTVAFVAEKHKKWLHSEAGNGRFDVWTCINLLDQLVDDSDPDIDLPNSQHLFQSAEAIRQAYPGEGYDWLHLTALVHDLGKVMALWGEEQPFVVGDTFPVGCKFADEIVFSHQFVENPDAQHPVYSTEYGIYEPRCGLESLIFSWGHDEYLYQVLKRNGCTIPPEGLNMVRYHSFYPWHTGGAYQHLTTEHDQKVTLPWVKAFNQFDLYSKSSDALDIERLWNEYYKGVAEKYNIGGDLSW